VEISGYSTMAVIYVPRLVPVAPQSFSYAGEIIMI